MTDPDHAPDPEGTPPGPHPPDPPPTVEATGAPEPSKGPHPSHAPEPPFDLEAVRARIPILERRVVMTGCSHAPLSYPVREAGEAYLAAWDEDSMQWERWVGEVERAKAAFAAVVGGVTMEVAAEEVAVSTSLSAVASSVASALDFSGERRTIVTTDAEFPTVGHVWAAQERRGAHLRWVEAPGGRIDAGAYEAAIDADTLLVSVPAAHYESGFRPELGPVVEAAREAGALVFVDAYQAAGTGPLDPAVLEADILASGCVKYLMGTSGVAFLRVRPEVAERLEPTVTGWFGRKEPFAFEPRTLDWAEGARRFETGTPPVPAAVLARAGMEWLAEVGIEAVGRWNRVLSRALVEGGLERGLELASPEEVARKTPLTAFRVSADGRGSGVRGGGADSRTGGAPADAHAVEAALRERHVLASARGGVIRLAPHFYNTLDDVERALDALAEVLE